MPAPPNMGVVPRATVQAVNAGAALHDVVPGAPFHYRRPGCLPSGMSWPSAAQGNAAIRMAAGRGRGRSPLVPKNTGLWPATYQAPVAGR